MIEQGMQPSNSWQVSLGCDMNCDDPSEKIRWQGLRRNTEVIFKEEPDSSLWQRLKVRVIGWLPIDEAL
jgi:hypothetical protein